MMSLSSDQTREEEEVDSSLDSRIGHRNKNGRGDNNYYSDDSTMTDQDTFDVTEEFDHASSQQQTHTGTEKTGSTSYSQYIFGFFQMPDFSSFGLSAELALNFFDQFFKVDFDFINRVVVVLSHMVDGSLGFMGIRVDMGSGHFPGLPALGCFQSDDEVEP